MVVVVLGCRPGSPARIDELRGRVGVGVDVLQNTDSQYLVLSGSETDPSVPRAECALMRDLAVERGVDPARIRLETKALDTIGNGYFSRLLVEDLDREIDTVRVVSSDYHVERARYVFERCFGPEYEIVTPAWYDANVPLEERHESRSLRRNREFFDGIRPGDIAAIGRRLRDSHDYYRSARTPSP